MLSSVGIPTLGWAGALARLAIAAGLSSLIGFERELRERAAGLRTHILVAVGAALFTLVSAYGFDDFLHPGSRIVSFDPSRIAAQVVTGVGFLGAGAIIRHGTSVRGLTTAATLWVSAAIGIAAGAGYYSGAVVATGVTLVALWPLRYLDRVSDRFSRGERRVVVQLQEGVPASRILDWLGEHGARIGRVRVETRDGTSNVTVTLKGPERVLVELADLDFVRGVEWER